MKSTTPKKTPDPYCVVVGQVLRETRERLGLSLEAAAARAGLSRQAVRFVECATYCVRLDNYKRLARALGLVPSRVLAKVEARMARAARGAQRAPQR